MSTGSGDIFMSSFLHGVHLSQKLSWKPTPEKFLSYFLMVLYKIFKIQTGTMNGAAWAENSQISMEDIGMLMNFIGYHYTKN